MHFQRRRGARMQARGFAGALNRAGTGSIAGKRLTKICEPQVVLKLKKLAGTTSTHMNVRTPHAKGCSLPLCKARESTSSHGLRKVGVASKGNIGEFFGSSRIRAIRLSGGSSICNLSKSTSTSSLGNGASVKPLSEEVSFNA